jgi:dienelactone hydrolase
MKKTRISYIDERQSLEGYLAVPDAAHALPGALLVPSWLNVNESICMRANRLAELGYVAFVTDLFGAGVRPSPPQSPMDVVGPFLRDRSCLRQRLCAGLQVFQSRPESNPERIAAIGYCIGGCGVLELARAGAPPRGVVSLHGLLSSPMLARQNTIQAKILVLHDDADPLAPFEQLAAFRDEMRTAGANWELDLYGGARHSFTGEGVLDQTSPEAGLHPQSEQRAWRATLESIAEVLQ